MLAAMGHASDDDALENAMIEMDEKCVSVADPCTSL